MQQNLSDLSEIYDVPYRYRQQSKSTRNGNFDRDVQNTTNFMNI